MPHVFDYTDFRKYLADYYAEQKAARSSFSYQYLAQKAGFRNKGFVHSIINGRKNLSPASVYKLSQALRLNRPETEYFESLVAFNQASSGQARTHFYTRMERVKQAGIAVTAAQVLRRDQYEFYSKWYYGAVRSLIDMHRFDGDFAWLAQAVRPAITVRQARAAVTLLERLGLAQRNTDGVYRVTSKTVSTGPEVQSVAVLNLHLDMMKLAADAVSTLPRSQRHVSGLLLGISRKTYEQICQETQAFQERILALAEADEQADQVYQYNFHLFPVSRCSKPRSAT